MPITFPTAGYLLCEIYTIPALTEVTLVSLTKGTPDGWLSDRYSVEVSGIPGTVDVATDCIRLGKRTATLAEVEADLAEAKAAIEVIDEDIAAKVGAYKKALEAEYAERRTALTETSYKRAYEREALEQVAIKDHEWEGRKVVMTIKNRRAARELADTYVYGIVETRRKDTPMPANKSYGLPYMGQAFVRLLKKDGTPGLQVAALGWLWKLVEETADAA